VKVIIDLIEDMREQIPKGADFVLVAMLLKEDSQDPKRLIYSGEAPIGAFQIDHKAKQLILAVDPTREGLGVEDLAKHLLILGMKEMMYEVRIAPSSEHPTQEVVGFGLDSETGKYGLFIMA